MMIEAKQGEEHISASVPDSIGSYRMASCIGAAVLNHTQQKAWMAHESGWSNNPDVLVRMIADATSEEDAGDKISVWLIGACIGNDRAIKQITRDDRKFAEEKMHAEFPEADLHCEFPDDPIIMRVSVIFEFDPQKQKWTGIISKETW